MPKRATASDGMYNTQTMAATSYVPKATVHDNL